MYSTHYMMQAELLMPKYIEYCMRPSKVASLPNLNGIRHGRLPPSENDPANFTFGRGAQYYSCAMSDIRFE